MSIVNKREYRIFALRRSGQHAVIDWIHRNCTGDVYLLNCPTRHQNIFTNVGDSAYYPGNKLFELDLAQEKQGTFSKKDNLIYNQENPDLTSFHQWPIEKNHDLYVGASSKRYDLLILRDPYNLFASHFKRYFKQPRKLFDTYFNEHLFLWKQHAKEFLGYTNYLGNKVTINYNDWFSCKQERHNIAKKLGLMLKDDSNVRISRFGHGSSFDATDQDMQASDMQVLERYKAYSDNILYKSLFDEETIELSKEIFGEYPLVFEHGGINATLNLTFQKSALNLKYLCLKKNHPAIKSRIGAVISRRMKSNYPHTYNYIKRIKKSLPGQ